MISNNHRCGGKDEKNNFYFFGNLMFDNAPAASIG